MLQIVYLSLRELTGDPHLYIIHTTKTMKNIFKQTFNSLVILLCLYLLTGFDIIGTV